MTDPASPVTRADIEARLRAVQGELQEASESAKQVAVAAAAIGGVVLVSVVYALGRRRGRKGRAVVEIRRV